MFGITPQEFDSQGSGLSEAILVSEHLPECLALLNDSTWDGDCICKALNACEQRVTAAAVQRVEALDWAFIHSTGELITRAGAVAAIKGDQ